MRPSLSVLYFFARKRERDREKNGAHPDINSLTGLLFNITSLRSATLRSGGRTEPMAIAANICFSSV